MIADFFRKKSEGDIRSVEAVSKESQLYYSVDGCNRSTSFVVDEPIYVADLDEYLFQAAYWVINSQKASIGNLQRVFKIGFNRAARIMEQLAEVGVVGPEEGTKPRRILVSFSDWEHIQRRIKNKTPEEQKPVITEEQNGTTPVENISFIEIMDKLNGHQFEYFCAAVLLKNGFSDVSATQGSGDQGVDIVATKSEIRYAVQCKHYSGALGNAPIQEVTAGKIFYKCHVGVVMTNSYFTSGAKELAKATGILLWDRQKLLEMI